MYSLFDDDYVTTDQIITDEILQRTGIDQIYEILGSPDYTSDQRKSLFLNYFNTDSPSVIEVIHNFIISYIENGSEHIKYILKECLSYDFIPFILRYKIFNDISELDSNTMLSTHPIWEGGDISDAPFLFDLCKGEYLKKLLTMTRIPEETRLKYLLNMENCSEYAEDFLYIITEPKNVVLILQKIDQSPKIIEYLKKLCIEDRYAIYICDFFLQMEDTKDWAKDRIKKIEGYSENVYNSSQNIHQVSANVDKFVEHILTFELSDLTDIIEQWRLDEKPDICIDSIYRISQDETIYSGTTLSNIFRRMWTFILKHDYKNFLISRCWEELAEMHSSCSTGHLLRLINIFTGIEGGIVLDIFTELKSIIIFRLNKIIEYNIHDSTIKDKILEELGTGQDIYIQSYIYKDIANLKNELWNDYSSILSSQQFEEYYRTIITDYTSGGGLPTRGV
jgi:hypothetical protein